MKVRLAHWLEARIQNAQRGGNGLEVPIRLGVLDVVQIMLRELREHMQRQRGLRALEQLRQMRVRE